MFQRYNIFNFIDDNSNKPTCQYCEHKYKESAKSLIDNTVLTNDFYYLIIDGYNKQFYKHNAEFERYSIIKEIDKIRNMPFSWTFGLYKWYSGQLFDLYKSKETAQYFNLYNLLYRAAVNVLVVNCDLLSNFNNIVFDHAYNEMQTEDYFVLSVYDCLINMLSNALEEIYANRDKYKSLYQREVH